VARWRHAVAAMTVFPVFEETTSMKLGKKLVIGLLLGAVAAWSVPIGALHAAPTAGVLAPKKKDDKKDSKKDDKHKDNKQLDPKKDDHKDHKKKDDKKKDGKQ
jgi:hypothetical protein